MSTITDKPACRTHAGSEIERQVKEMNVQQDNTIGAGDNVRPLSGRHKGETGTAVNVSWHSNRFGSYARVRVRFDGGETDDFTMGNLEKVQDSTDGDAPLSA